MLTAIDFTFGAFEVVLLGLVISKYRPHILVVLHTAIFWLFIVVFNGVSTYTVSPRYDDVTYAFVHLLVLLYLLIALGIGVRHRGASHKLIESIAEIPRGTLIACMTAWLVFRLYLLGKYGAGSFNLMGNRMAVGAAYWEVALISYLWYLAFGGFLSFVIQATVRPRAFLRPALLFLVSAFVVFAVLFNETGGTRRFLLMVAMLVFLVAFYWHGRRALVNALVVAIPLVMVAEYYQLIRHNLAAPDFVSALADADYPKAMLIYLDPTSTHESKSSIESFGERFSPFTVLYEITAQQLDQDTTTDGELVVQTFRNAVPAAFVPGKTTINADELLSNAFPVFPRDDLPSGVVAMLQSDFGFICYLVAPVLLTLVIVAYSSLIRRSRSEVLRVVLLCLAIGTAQFIEELMDAILVQLRDVIVIAAIVYVARALTRSLLFNLHSASENPEGRR